MTLSLDGITLGVPEVKAAKAFYESVYSPQAADHGESVNLDLNGVGEVALYGIEALARETAAEPATSGFRGYTVSVVVNQPSEVQTMLDVAVKNGAKVLKPAKKALFGGFNAHYQAPDGAVWELGSENKKDTGPAADPPRPNEIVAILGVADPKESKVFYEALGLTVDNDYGSKFVDFNLTPGTCKLGLMQRKTLAKEAGIDDAGDGFHAVVLNRRAESREEVDAVLKAAAAAGGTIVVAAGESESGGYAGHFTDPDGFQWKVATA